MKVLIVEDEQRLADSLARGLKLKGNIVDVLYDGQSALQRLCDHANDYDIVILDLMLPAVTGLDICKTVRKLGIVIPILVLTATENVESKVNLLLSGADDYMVKPFSFDELTARLYAILRRPKECEAEILRAGDIEVNTIEHKVYQAGVLLELTLKEYALLEYLMRRPQQVVNRKEILSKLWDYNYDSFSNVLDVHVKNLRKKINKKGVPDILETVRGVGYRLHP